ncbi:MAG: hypothetical protein R8N23_00200 [Reichenbachiella sp.]|uniref:hypothetical protein n=1 Tax=Reichenbachiella sp. TaxID=2184521 RepID=UPI002965D71E|nr:hypothetical protein [Reichenbachiella sp.]MDW3208254.1 hypothetical protein [Reichenbachiella sp.]
MNKFFAFPLLGLFISCLSPDDISISADSDIEMLDQTLKSLAEMQTGHQLNKLVKLDETEEVLVLEFDTTLIKKDLKALLDVSYSRLIRSTNYSKIQIKDSVIFERKAKEKKGPVSVVLTLDNGKINFCEVNFQNENYLYQENQAIQLTLVQGKLDSYKIVGSRKLIGLDPSSYQIKVNLIKY